MTRMGLVAVLCFAACRGGTSAPSRESHEPLWCPRPVSADSACPRVDKEACEQLYDRECAPLDTFACYETDFTSARESCFAALAGCERGRTDAVAVTLKQYRDRIGPCTIYRVKR